MIVAGVERAAESVITGDGFRFVALDIRRRSRNLRRVAGVPPTPARTVSARTARPRPSHHHQARRLRLDRGEGRERSRHQRRDGPGAPRWRSPGCARSRHAVGIDRGVSARVPGRSDGEFSEPGRSAVVRPARCHSCRGSVLIRGAGVDTDLFHPHRFQTARRSWFWPPACCGRIAEFVEAARQLKSRGVACRFVLVGVPDNENPHAVPKEDLERWHAEGLVEWWGLRNDMPHVLRSATIVALPTTYPEGVPKILLEAAACGRPIVAPPMCRVAGRSLRTEKTACSYSRCTRSRRCNTNAAEPTRLRARMGARGRDIAVAEFSNPGRSTRRLRMPELLGETVAPHVAAAVM